MTPRPIFFAPAGRSSGLRVWLVFLAAYGIAEAGREQPGASGPAKPTADRPMPAERVFRSETVQIIAHRGASRRAPENTLPAFQLALQAAADLVELDYFHSLDQVPVVFHDDMLDRTTDARRWGLATRAVGQVPWSTLRKLDAGSWFDSQFQGTRIPSLESSVKAIRVGAVPLLERKQGDAATSVRLLSRLRAVVQVVVQAFDWEFLAECHRLEPRLSLVALGDKPLDEQAWDRLGHLGVKGIGWNQERLDATAIAAAHRRGLRVWSYTVDDPTRARTLVRAGIDGLITNRPAEMRGWIRGAGDRPPE